ncbi:vesicle-associated protein 4-2-like [Panicum miliaceum]|uniref:Vesicle-associated protein 4-2-like n=1 Tax=Panicum miliaceum TaxID=4540 RepID=A0A3L6PUC2_PANMI|nr:vesicle-associated protein 4-2-like [Panicum miliaceum]
MPLVKGSYRSSPPKKRPAPTIRSPAPHADGEPLLVLPEEERYRDGREEEDAAEWHGRLGLCHMPLWGTASGPPAAEGEAARAPPGSSGGGGVKVIRSLLPTRRRLRLDPPAKLYFPYEPGKQVRSAVRIKNISKSHVAFKFQTTAPKSCFMRPPGSILAPGESIIATVFKFVEHPENNEKPLDQKCKVKFKIVSLKVKGPMEYVPELFDEQKDQVAVEQILRVVFLDPERPSPQMDKLKRQLAEAEAALEARKKPPEDNGPRIVGEGLVIDEWKERRERYLARQQIEGVDSV